MTGYLPLRPSAMRLGEGAVRPSRLPSPSLNHSVPVYRFDCSIGCLPLPPFLCVVILRAAILEACRMALDAARKLETRPPDAATGTLFHSVFGHHPWEPFPGTWNVASGDLASCQLRMVENTLRFGNVLYRCDPCARIRDDPPQGSILDTYAIAIPAQNLVLLCPTFWSLSAPLKAGVLLHEIFHVRFHPFFRHDAKERRQNSAYCYEVFALSAKGATPDPLAVSTCKALPLM